MLFPPSAIQPVPVLPLNELTQGAERIPPRRNPIPKAQIARRQARISAGSQAAPSTPAAHAPCSAREVVDVDRLVCAAGHAP
jgi:hypothetical protein